jgi:serine protease Do
MTVFPMARPSCIQMNPIPAFLTCLLTINQVLSQDSSAQQVYKEVLPCIATLVVKGKEGEFSQGSGFLTIKPNLMVTAWHVVDGAKLVLVKFSDGEEVFSTGIVTRDVQRDLAVIRVPIRGRPLLKIAPNIAEVGSRCYVVGTPKGLHFSISDGLISQIRTSPVLDQYQFTCSISPGNSGGPLLSEAGEVLGVVSWQVKDGQNLNFAVHASYLESLDVSVPTTPWDTIEPSETQFLARLEKPEALADDQATHLFVNGFLLHNKAMQTLIVQNRNIERIQLSELIVLPELLVVLDELKAIGGKLRASRCLNQDKEPLRHALHEMISSVTESVEFMIVAVGKARGDRQWSEEPQNLVTLSRAAFVKASQPRDVVAALKELPDMRERLPEYVLNPFGLVEAAPRWRLGALIYNDGGLVVAIDEGSCAQQIGLIPGDILMGVDSEKVDNPFHLRKFISQRRGKTVRVHVDRNGRSVTLRWKVPKDLL